MRAKDLDPASMSPAIREQLEQAEQQQPDLTHQALVLTRAKGRADREKLEKEFLLQLRAADLTAGMEREFRFHHTKGWRFDFAWPAVLVAAEVEGVMGGDGGRHQRIAGYTEDCNKYNAAQEELWCVLRFTGSHVYSGEALQTIERVLRGRAVTQPRRHP